MKFKEIKETELAEFPTNEEDVLGDNNTALDNSHSQSTDIPLLSLNLLLEIDIKKRKWKYIAGFFILGIINNLGYMLIMANAEWYCLKFRMPNLVPLFQFNLITFGCLSRLTLAYCSMKVPQGKRNLFFSLFFTLSYSGLAISAIIPFEHWGYIWRVFGITLAFLAAILMGIPSAAGEASLFGYLKNYPGTMIASFSLGLGIAGFLLFPIFGTMIIFSLPQYFMFLLPLPIIILYPITFKWIDMRKNFCLMTKIEGPESEKKELEMEKQGKANLIGINIASDTPLSVLEIEKTDTTSSLLSTKLCTAILSKTWWYIFNLTIVYFFEDVIITCLSDRTAQKLLIINREEDNTKFQTFISENAFALMAASYLIGAFISRISLAYYQSKQVGIFSFFQFLNLLFWVAEALYLFTHEYIYLFLLMIFCGLMGGGSYVNNMYIMLNTPKLHPSQRELAVTLIGIFSDFGIIAAALVALIIDAYIIPL